MKKRGSFCYFRGNSGGKELQSESLIGIIKCYNAPNMGQRALYPV